MHDDRQLKAHSNPLILVSCYMVCQGFHLVLPVQSAVERLVTKEGSISSSIYTKLRVSKRANCHTFD